MILKNHRHEAFAQQVAKGMSASAAYRKVYGKRGKKNADCMSARLSVKVGNRVAELQRKAESAAVLSMQERRAFLASVVRASVGKLPKDSPLLQAIKVTTRKGSRDRDDEQTVEYKLPDKRACIELDAKLSGELEDRVEVRVRVEPAQVMDRVRKISPVLAGIVGGKN